MAGHAAGARGWGNEEFAVPGHFAASADSERVRREVVLAVAEHDNGWLEWEADPPLSADVGLPKGLGEVVAHPVAGMEQLLVGSGVLSRGTERRGSSVSGRRAENAGGVPAPA